MLLSHPVRLHSDHRQMAADVFSRIANKSPVRCTIRGTGLESNSSYYDIVTLIHERCQDCSGKIDRALIDGKLKLPADLNIESDGQIYTLNWPSRLDRRNMELSCYCSVDVASRFIPGMHSNYDDTVDPFKINREAAIYGDMERLNTSDQIAIHHASSLYYYSYFVTNCFESLFL